MRETAWSRITFFTKEKRITWSMGTLPETLARGQAGSMEEARQAVHAAYRHFFGEE